MSVSIVNGNDQVAWDPGTPGFRGSDIKTLSNRRKDPRALSRQKYLKYILEPCWNLVKKTIYSAHFSVQYWYLKFLNQHMTDNDNDNPSFHYYFTSPIFFKVSRTNIKWKVVHNCRKSLQCYDARPAEGEDTLSCGRGEEEETSLQSSRSNLWILPRL